MEAQLSNSAPSTLSDGKRTKKEATSKPKLTQQDEFSILLTQISACRDSGLLMDWIRLKPDNVVALIMPGVQLCSNNHLFIGEKCNYCPPPTVS